MCFAVSMKVGTDSLETTTWTDAMALRSFRRQTWSSWTDSTPGICLVLAPISTASFLQSDNRSLKIATNLSQIVLDILEIHTKRRTLQQDQARVLDQRERREEDHDGDEEAHGGVRVEAGLALGLPDGDSDDHDADVVDRVAGYVEDHAEHAEVVARGREGESCVAVFVVAAGLLGRPC